jgi:hypothetical protein
MAPTVVIIDFETGDYVAVLCRSTHGSYDIGDNDYCNLPRRSALS